MGRTAQITAHFLKERRFNRVTARLDPGEYVFSFFLGLNECRQVVWFEKGKDYRVKLSPSCDIAPEEL